MESNSPGDHSTPGRSKVDQQALCALPAAILKAHHRRLKQQNHGRAIQMLQFQELEDRNNGRDGPPIPCILRHASGRSMKIHAITDQGFIE